MNTIKTFCLTILLLINLNSKIFSAGITDNPKDSQLKKSHGTTNISDVKINNLLDDKGKAIISNNVLKRDSLETDALSERILTGVDADDNFGTSVSNAGDVNGDGYDDIIVAAPHVNSIPNFGRAYIYFGGFAFDNNADVVLSSSPDPSSEFAVSVASAGDVNGDSYDDVIVGSYLEGADARGRAYIFYGGSNMNNVSDINIYPDVGEHFFGSTVSSAGDINGDGFGDVIIGSAKNQFFPNQPGKSYIYLGGPAMDAAADITLNGFAIDDYFGYSVANAGDVNGDSFADVIVGAPEHQVSAILEGRSYIYLGGNSMDNIVDVVLTAVGSSDDFGVSVSSAGNVNGDNCSDVIVGSFVNGGTGAGKTYMYYGSSTMNNAADVIFTSPEAGDFFGISVSSAGDLNADDFDDIVIGAPKSDAAGADAGRANLYLGGSTMDNVSDITLTGESPGDEFGSSVSSCESYYGGNVIAGSPLNDAAGNNSGKTYLYLTGQSTFDEVFTGENEYDEFGSAISSAGDVNGDGFDDIIIGSKNAGKAYIFFGGSSINQNVDVTLTGTASALFGLAVSCAGDINYDGYADVIVGAPFDGTGGTNAGRAYVYFGGLMMDNNPDVVFTGQTQYQVLGSALSKAEDINGDNFIDIVIGGGGTFIYFGSSQINNVVDLTIADGSGKIAGNVNGDGFSDVAAGNSLYFGSINMNNVPDLTIQNSGWANNGFGPARPAGDVNGDGFDDIILTESRFEWMPYTFTTSTSIYYGGSPMNTIPDGGFGHVTGSMNVDYYSAAGVGDLNGDGNDDAASGFDYPTTAGSVNVQYGNTSNGHHYVGGDNDAFGYSVSSAGDVNGDGSSDLLISAPRDYSAGINSGRVYLYLSSLSPKITVNMRTFIEGFFNPPRLYKQVQDSMRVHLRSSSSPFAIVDSTKTFLSSTGTATIRFSHAHSGNYYMVLKHRNSIETWSKNGGEVLTAGGTASYDWTTNASQAYGDNMKQVSVTPWSYAMYSGDINQSGDIDVTDVIAVYNNAVNFVSGYVSTDVTGDNFTDISDLIITHNNAVNFISKITP